MKLRAVLVAVVVMAMAGVASANLLFNEGFSNNGGFGSTPTGWTGDGKEGVANWGSHDGDGWLMMFQQWGAGVSGVVYQDVAGGAGDYTLDFWQEGDNAWSGTAFSVSMIWFDASGSQVGAPAVMDLQSWALANTGWTNHILTATSPLNTATVRVQFAATTLDDAQGAAKVDQLDFTVAAIPEPTTLGLLGLSLLGVLALRRRARG